MGMSPFLYFLSDRATVPTPHRGLSTCTCLCEFVVWHCVHLGFRLNHVSAVTGGFYFAIAVQ